MQDKYELNIKCFTFWSSLKINSLIRLMNGMFASSIISQYRCIPKPFLKWENPGGHFHILRGRQWEEFTTERTAFLIHWSHQPWLSSRGEMKVNVAVFVPNYNQWSSKLPSALLLPISNHNALKNYLQSCRIRHKLL